MELFAPGHHIASSSTRIEKNFSAAASCERSSVIRDRPDSSIGREIEELLYWGCGAWRGPAALTLVLGQHCGGTKGGRRGSAANREAWPDPPWPPPPPWIRHHVLLRHHGHPQLVVAMAPPPKLCASAVDPR